MALIVTTWSPSTCNCVIEYEWDTEHPPETRMHRVVNVKHCQAAGAADGHPKAEHGEIVEGSAFHEDHAVVSSGREHWNLALKDNPHWPKRKA